MCWISKATPNKKVAKTDIIVYKIVKRDNSNKGCYSFYNYYPYFYGDKNTEQPLSATYDSLAEVYCIDRGYHSYLNIEATKREYKRIVERDAIIAKCTIPKDSVYYESDIRDEAVSSNIIINGPI